MSEFLKKIAGMSPQRLALLADTLRQKLETQERRVREPIAVIGVSCRFPGASTPQAYWDLLCEGRQTLRDIPKERWDHKEWYDPDPHAPGKMYVSGGGFIENIDMFDPGFFNISPREAACMDPQQRILLELAWEALENAGIPRERIAGSHTGVFVGIGPSHYVGGLRPAEPEKLDIYSGIGNAACIAAGRLSFVFGFTGPNFPLHTACSSSLVATHIACRSLRNRESDMALAGGINLVLQPHENVYFSRLGVLSPTNRCHSFDDRADGFIRSDGCGFVILKRLSDAEADGDDILAVIRNSAINHDGRGTGLLVPDEKAQAAVIREAMANTGIGLQDISYIEAHGTGTSIGDPVELMALKAVFGDERSLEDPVPIGSVKTNIGHLETAAGIAGLIKLILSLKHRQIPPQADFKNPTTRVDWESLPLKVVTELTPWQARNGKRVAGISSYGFSGTNCHLLVEEAPNRSAPTEGAERPLHLLCVSAKSPEALTRISKDIGTMMDQRKDAAIADVCYTANARRSHFSHRLAFLTQSSDHAAAMLKDYTDQGFADGLDTAFLQNTDPPEIAFLFTGQGAQYVGMGRELFESQPLFRQTLIECHRILEDHLDRPLLDVIYDSDRKTSDLDQTVYTQAALFSIEYALARLWQNWGITPAVVMGHSIGEYAAACVAGVFSLEDALKLVATRGRLIQSLPPNGAMAAVMAAPEDFARELEPHRSEVSLAGLNGPENTVISGPKAVVQQLTAALSDCGIRSVPLNVSHAFHSPMMDPILDEFEDVASHITYANPTMPIISNVTGELAAKDQINRAAYWREHLLRTVRFADGMHSLHQEGYRVFLEVGPQPILLGMGRQGAPSKGQKWLPSLRPPGGDWNSMLQSLKALYLLGASVDWRNFDAGYARRMVPLPNYPMQRQRYWLEGKEGISGSRAPYAEHHLLGKRVSSPIQTVQYESLIDASHPKYLKDYQVREFSFLPLGGLVDTILKGAAEFADGCPIVLSGLTFAADIFLRAGEQKYVQTVYTQSDAGNYQVDMFSQPEAEQETTAVWKHHLSAMVRIEAELSHLDAGLQERIANPLRNDAQSREVDPAEIYRRWATDGLTIGTAAQTLQTLQVAPDGATARLGVPGNREWENSQAVVLEGALQALAAFFSATDSTRTLIATGLDELVHYPAARQEPCCRALIQPSALRLDDHRIKGDIVLTDAEGHPLTVLRGVQLASLDKIKRQILKKEIQDWFYTIEWRACTAAADDADAAPSTTSITQAIQDPLPPADVDAGYWIIFTGENDFGRQLVKGLQQSGYRSVTVSAAGTYTAESGGFFTIDPTRPAHFHRLLDDIHNTWGSECRGILHLWSMDARLSTDLTIPALKAACSKGCGSVLHLAQALGAKTRWRTIRLMLLTRGAQAVSGDTITGDGRGCPAAAVAQAPLWGLGLSLAAEMPDLGCVRIDLDPDDARYRKVEIDRLMAEITRSDFEDMIAYRRGRRYVARLIPARIESDRGVDSTHRHTAGQAATATSLLPPATPLSAGATYLITGGLGGLGLCVAEWLVDQGARHLVLLGRSGVTESAQEKIDRMKQQGARVHVFQADVSVKRSLSSVFQKIKATLPPLRGIVHAAGIADEGILAQQNLRRLNRTLAPKVVGTWNLHQLSRRIPLDFFVLFSSTSAVLRTPGAGPYAAGNAFLDAFAHYRRQLALPAVSIHWAAWTRIGMAARRNDAETKWGIGSIPPHSGVLALEEILQTDGTEIVVLPVQWGQFALEAPPLFRSPLIEDLLPDINLPASATLERIEIQILRQRLQRAGRNESKALLIAFFQNEVVRVLGMTSADRPDPNASLLELGLDSMMGFELKTTLEEAIGQTVPITATIESPTITRMIDFVVDEVMGKSGEDEPVEIADSAAALHDTGALEKKADTDQSLEKMRPAGLTASASPWFWHYAKHDARMRLFCFPHSGAGASTYRPWGPHLSDGIELWSVQYPGRETRITEAAIEDMDSMCAALQEAIEPHLDQPYAFFGHSMGALLAFAFSQKLMRASLPLPRTLCLSGCAAPQLMNSEASVATLSDGELKDMIMDLGLMPSDMIAEPELVELHLAIIRADFKLFESYSSQGITPLDCPIVALAGRSDPRVDRDQLLGWKVHTHKDFRAFRFPGGHFYLQDVTRDLVQEIADDLGASESTGRHLN